MTHNPGPAALRHVERMYVYYCRTYEKAVSGGGERGKGGHVLRDTTSRGLPLVFGVPVPVCRGQTLDLRRGYEASLSPEPSE